MELKETEAAIEGILFAAGEATSCALHRSTRR